MDYYDLDEWEPLWTDTNCWSKFLLSSFDLPAAISMRSQQILTLKQTGLNAAAAASLGAY